MIIYSGADGGSLFVNKAWLEFSGRSFAEELGDGYADTAHHSANTLSYQFLARALLRNATKRHMSSCGFAAPKHKHRGMLQDAV